MKSKNNKKSKKDHVFRRKYKLKQKKILRIVKFLSKMFFLIFVIFCVIYFLYLVDVLFRNLNDFRVVSIRDFAVLTDNSVLVENKTSFLYSNKESFKSIPDIKSKLSQQFGYDQSNILIKNYLGRYLLVEFVDLKPVSGIITPESIELIDKYAKKVRSINLDKLNLSSDEIRLLSKEIFVHDDFVKTKYLENLESEEAKRKVKWDEVEEKIKLQVLQQELEKVIFKINSHVSTANLIIRSSEYNEVQLIINILPYYINNFKDIPMVLLDSVLFVKNELNRLNKNIVSIELITKFSFKIIIQENKTLIFTTKRDISSQLLDLMSIFANNLDLKLNVFDLRSEHFTGQ